jgi:hypothetical protein
MKSFFNKKSVMFVFISLMSKGSLAQEGLASEIEKIQIAGSALRAVCSIDKKSLELVQIVPDGKDMGMALPIAWGAFKNLSANTGGGNCKNRADTLNKYFESNREYNISIDPKNFSSESPLDWNLKPAFSKGSEKQDYLYQPHSESDPKLVSVSADEQVAVRCTKDCGAPDAAPCLEIFKIPSNEKLKEDHAANSHFERSGTRSNKPETQDSLRKAIEESASFEKNKINFAKYSITKVGFGTRFLKESGVGPRCSDAQTQLRFALGSQEWRKKDLMLQFPGFDLKDPKSLIIPAAGAGLSAPPVFDENQSVPPAPVQHQKK